MPAALKRLLCTLCCCTLLCLCVACSGLEGNVKEEPDAASSAAGNIPPADKPAASGIEIDPHTQSGDYDYNTINGDNTPQQGYYTPISLTHGFDALQTQPQQYFYKRLTSDVYTVAQQPSEDGNYLIEKIYLPGMYLEEEEIRLVIEAFSNDHPEVFWLDNLFGYTFDGTDMVIQMYSIISPETIDAYTDEMNAVADSMIASVPKGLDEYGRERFIHDSLLARCTYATDTKSIQQNWKPFTIYGALIEGSAVCEGYTKAMQYLLRFVGIESIPVNGTAKEQWHQWNLVKIDGCWYHLDATWNDSTDYIFYDYFNITDTIIQYDHQVASDFFALDPDDICGSAGKEAQLFNITLPPCTETAANFYIHEAVILYGFDEKASAAVENKMLQAALEKKQELYIQVSNSMEYNEAVEGLFYQAPYQFFTYIDHTNSLLGGEYAISKENVRIIKKERLRIVEIRLEYI